MSVHQAAVLADMTEMLHTILDDYGLDDVEIGMETTFHDELALESVDLVTLASMLGERYGDRVNFAEFVAGQDLDSIIALRVGQLVDYVVAALAPAEAGSA